MTEAIEVRIAYKGSRRIALYRTVGTTSRFWHAMPVRQAERAIRDGKISIGIYTNVPAVSGSKAGAA